VNVECVKRKTGVANTSKSTGPFTKNSGSIVFLSQIKSYDDSIITILKYSADINQIFLIQSQAHTTQEVLSNHPAVPVHLPCVLRSILTCLLL
jgi:hypothetical protein